MELGLQGKNAVITGGGGAFGRRLALDLAKEGVNVAVSGRSASNVEKTVDLCRRHGVKSHAVICDLANADECATLVAQAEEAMGPMDILVNNAGHWPTNEVRSIPIEEWRYAMDVNLTAVFINCRSFVNSVLNRNAKGKILNVTSQAAFNGATTGHAHYATAKSGVVTLTISLSREVAPKGINVNAIAIGIMESEIFNGALEKNYDYYVKRIPIGKIAQPGDLTPTAIFLVSSAADYVTGATFDVSGGMITR